MGERPFLRGLQGAAFQTLMKCKEQELMVALMGGVPKELERWQDTYIIEQHRVWMHDVDVILISFIVSSSHGLYDGSMGEQQNTLLLCLREQGKNCSHTLHDVAEGGDGIISFVFYDREVLPHWEGILMY